MVLLLMRHGIAEETGSSDAARPLTAEGSRRVGLMGVTLRDSGITPTHYAASPRVRAQQTAAQVAGVFGGGNVAALASLDFEGNWFQLVEEISALTKNDPAAVVLAAGHQPKCGDFLTEMIFGATIGFEFRKGAIAGLRWDGPIGNGAARFDFYWTWAMIKHRKFAAGE
jgi:phosphohistidine phosphatase SixA